MDVTFIRRIEALFRKGLSPSDIGRIVKCSTGHVCRCLPLATWRDEDIEAIDHPTYTTWSEPALRRMLEA